MNYYRDFRLKNITEPQFKHLLLLLYWPIYIAVFLLLERIQPSHFINVYSPIDDYIPFCEFFLVPYCVWYPLLFWIVLYTMFFDIPSFKRYHAFVIISCTATLIIYFLFPNMQQLRPQEFARDNIFTDGVRFLYSIDTNTNVCPSLHVIFSMAILFTVWHSKRLGNRLWRTVFLITAILISLSTVFIKQHSVVDLVFGVALSFAIYPFVFKKKSKGSAC